MPRLIGAAAVAVALALAPPAAARSAGASVAHSVVTVSGKPFFPIMLLDQCDAGAGARAASVGVNVILNASCAARAPEKLSVLPIDRRARRSANLLGWAYPDEPDNNGWTPDALAKRFGYRAGSPDGLLSFVTTTSAFYTGADRRAGALAVRGFARIADVAGFDLYPLNHCSTSLSGVYDAQRRFARLAAGKPTFQWIETGAIRPDYCGGLHVTPAEVTAEAWLAVAGGARGIGFFTHTWSPAEASFDVSQPVQAAIARFAAVARAIAPGLTETTTGSRVDTPALRVLARVAGGRTYVVAVNTLRSPVPATVSVPRIRASTLRVVGEGRTVAVQGGRFADTFEPLGVHVYAAA